MRANSGQPNRNAADLEAARRLYSEYDSCSNTARRRILFMSTMTGLNEMSLGDFLDRLRATQSEQHNEKRHTIDVILAPRAEGSADLNSTTHLSSAAQERVRFIQINSEPLCAILRGCLKPENSSILSLYPNLPPVTMLTPFKPICYYLDRLKARLIELAAKYSGVSWGRLSAQIGVASKAFYQDRLQKTDTTPDVDHAMEE